MIKLTGKQNRYLRSQGQRLEATVVIGRAGLNDAIVDHIRKQLDLSELVKVRLTVGQGSGRREAAEEIAKITESACAGVVGRTLLLYRPNVELPNNERIKLP